MWWQGCYGELVAVVYTAGVNLSFLALFCHFYVTTYSRPRSPLKSDTKQA